VRLKVGSNGMSTFLPLDPDPLWAEPEPETLEYLHLNSNSGLCAIGHFHI
jgi:hypothetical protein